MSGRTVLEKRKRTRSYTGSLQAKIKPESDSDAGSASQEESLNEEPKAKKAWATTRPKDALGLNTGHDGRRIEASRGGLAVPSMEHAPDFLKDSSDRRVDLANAIPHSPGMSPSAYAIPMSTYGPSGLPQTPVQSPATPAKLSTGPLGTIPSPSSKKAQSGTPKRKGRTPIKDEKDVRQGLWRKKCPKATEDRAQRVMEQRMFMIHRSGEQDFREEFQILGSTGNVYTVTYAKTPSCDCPDYLKGNSPCKHLLFIALKVLHIPRIHPGLVLSDPSPPLLADASIGSNQAVDLHSTWYQKTLTTNELRRIFDNAPRAPEKLAGMMVDDRTRAIWAKHHSGDTKPGGPSVVDLTEEDNGMGEEGKPGDKMADGRRLPDDGDDCPICYDELVIKGKGQESLVYHLGVTGCGRALHQQCFAMWAATEQKVGNGHKVSCVYCRSVWKAGGQGGGSASGSRVEYEDGYTNLADVAGMNRERDTSTYYMGPRRGAKFRPWE